MYETGHILHSLPDPSIRGTMTRAVLSVLLLPLLILPESASAQVPEAQRVPAEAATSLSMSRSALMEFPAGQDIRRIAPDGAVVTSRWGSGAVTYTLHDPKSGRSTELPFSTSVAKSEYERVTEVRVDGHYVSFTDVRDPDIAIYNRETGEVRRLTHPEGGITFRVSVSPNTGDVLYERRSAPTSQSRVYLWGKGTDQPVLIDESAMSPEWAPSGNFFLLKRRTSAQDAGGDDKGSLYWWLYDQKGNPVLDMGRYGRASGFEDWSPDSRKIALDPAFGRPGLYIVYLKGDGRSVEIERARYIAAPKGQALGTPKWSPDGTKLAFTASYGGDQTGERSELRVLVNGSYRRYSAGRGSAYSLDPWGWVSPTVLYSGGAGTPAAVEKVPYGQLTKFTIGF